MQCKQSSDFKWHWNFVFMLCSMGCVYQNLMEYGMSYFINSARNADVNLCFLVAALPKSGMCWRCISLEDKVTNQNNQWTPHH
jgi:hypothetical protein